LSEVEDSDQRFSVVLVLVLVVVLDSLFKIDYEDDDEDDYDSAERNPTTEANRI
jgi:hypothetical protein